MSSPGHPGPGARPPSADRQGHGGLSSSSGRPPTPVRDQSPAPVRQPSPDRRRPGSVDHPGGFNRSNRRTPRWTPRGRYNSGPRRGSYGPPRGAWPDILPPPWNSHLASPSAFNWNRPPWSEGIRDLPPPCPRGDSLPFAFREREHESPSRLARIERDLDTLLRFMPRPK